MGVQVVPHLGDVIVRGLRVRALRGAEHRVSLEITVGRQISLEHDPSSVGPQWLQRDRAPGVDVAHEEEEKGVMDWFPPGHDSTSGNVQSEYLPSICLKLSAGHRNDVLRREQERVHARRAREDLPRMLGVGRGESVRPGRIVLCPRGCGQGRDEKKEHDDTLDRQPLIARAEANPRGEGRFVAV